MDTTEVATVKPKCCWVPFQKSYSNRKQFQGADYEPPPSVYYLKGMGADGQPVDTQVSLYEYEGDTDSHAIGTTELVLQGHPMPGMLGPEDSSLDGREIMFPNSYCNIKPDSLPMSLAEIEPNCMKKEFWVDEIIQGGALKCLNDMPGPSTFRARFGRQQAAPVEEIYKEDVEAQMIEGGQSPSRMERRPSRSRSRSRPKSPRRSSRSATLSPRRSRSMQSEPSLLDSFSDRVTIANIKKSRSEASRAAKINRQTLSEFHYVSNPGHSMQEKSQAEGVEPQGDGLTRGPSSKETKGFSLFGRKRSKKGGKEKKPKVVIDMSDSAEVMNKSARRQEELLLEEDNIRKTASLVDEDSAFQDSAFQELNAEGLSTMGSEQDLFDARVIDEKMEKMFEAARPASWSRERTNIASTKSRPDFALDEEKKDDGSGISRVQSFARTATPYSKSSDKVGSKKTLSSRQIMAEKIKKRVRSNVSAHSDTSPDGSNKSNTQEQGKRDVKQEKCVPGEEVEVNDPEQVLNWLQNRYSVDIDSRGDAISIKPTKTNLPHARSSGGLRRKQSANSFPFEPALNPFNDVSSSVFDPQPQTEVNPDVPFAVFESPQTKVDPDAPFAVFESATNPFLSIPSSIPQLPSGFSRSSFSDVGMVDVADTITARRKEKTKSTGRSIIQAPRRKDEEDSFGDDTDLNTEAFRKYEDSDEEDSIFSDLHTVEESVKGAEDSSPAVSRNVTKSKESDRAPRLKYSRRNNSKGSRGDLTRFNDAYSVAAHDGPFACMDKWLD